MVARPRDQSNFRLATFTFCHGYRWHSNPENGCCGSQGNLWGNMSLRTTPRCPHHGNWTVNSIKGYHHPGIGNAVGSWKICTQQRQFFVHLGTYWLVALHSEIGPHGNSLGFVWYTHTPPSLPRPISVRNSLFFHASAPGSAEHT